MFCENCGGKLNDTDKFCTKCGRLTTPTTKSEKKQPALSGDKWWHRLVKVIYIVLYLPLLLIIPLVWIENAPSYSAYIDFYSGSYGEAFGYSFLTLIIYVAVVRLLKITFLYIVMGEKPQWKKEVKKFF